MDIIFDCPECGQNLTVDKEGAGVTINCPKCSKSVTIPTSAEQQVGPSVARKPPIGQTELPPSATLAPSPKRRKQRHPPSESSSKSISDIPETGIAKQASFRTDQRPDFIHFSEPEIPRRSPWSLFLNVIGAISLMGALVGGFMAMKAVQDLKGLQYGNVSDSEAYAIRAQKTAQITVDANTGFILLVCGVVGGLQAFSLAFIVNVVTDTRWFLKRLVDETKHGPR